MHNVTIKRARGGFIIETEEPEPYVAARLSEALRIAATHLSDLQYNDNRVGDVIILTPAEPAPA